MSDHKQNPDPSSNPGHEPAPDSAEAQPIDITSQIDTILDSDHGAPHDTDSHQVDVTSPHTSEEDDERNRDATRNFETTSTSAAAIEVEPHLQANTEPTITPLNTTSDDTTADVSEPTQHATQDGLESTGPLPVDRVQAAAAHDDMTSQDGSFNPHPLAFDLSARQDSQIEVGATTRLSWAARTDVGLVRGHNEDSYLARMPLFGVCDGMGGHAAGEVASAIAVHAIAQHAPDRADDTLLGAAVEAANEAVITGSMTGSGKPGMGCTASCCIIENTHMAIAHVGDSRIYLLHAGSLVRITHDHSYVEELVDAGKITADEARTHPSRSIITRALGSDPDMYADHFTLDVERGDRIIVCSDGLSSMVPDNVIEALAVSSATPRECVDSLVVAALSEGGHDNVTVVVVDVVSDGREEARRHARNKAILGWLIAVFSLFVVVAIGFTLILNNSWYIGAHEGTVGIYHGIRGSLAGIPLSRLEESTAVSLAKLPEATQRQLASGISVSSTDEAHKTVQAYEEQIAKEQQKAQITASGVQSESSDTSLQPAPAESGTPSAATPETGVAGGYPTTTSEPAQSPITTTQGGE